jgi:hypothetical protein
VVPYSYNELQEQELLFKVEEEIRNMDPKYQCVITIENSYIADKKDK